MLKVEIEFPRDILHSLNIPASEVNSKAREWMTLEMFREGHISTGKAAEILGISKSQFIDILDQRSISYLDFTQEELVKQQAIAIAATMRPKD